MSIQNDYRFTIVLLQIVRVGSKNLHSTFPWDTLK